MLLVLILPESHDQLFLLTEAITVIDQPMSHTLHFWHNSLQPASQGHINYTTNPSTSQCHAYN